VSTARAFGVHKKAKKEKVRVRRTFASGVRGGGAHRGHRKGVMMRHPACIRARLAAVPLSGQKRIFLGHVFGPAKVGP
jgi:hypothetical protein